MSSTDVTVEPVEFYSDGTRIAGELFHPAPADQSPSAAPVVVGHGFGGIKQFFVGDIARTLAAYGHLALTFDYRGFGESDGRRNRLHPMEQVVDTISAVDYVASRAGDDSAPIGIYGTSFGGGVAVVAGCASERVGAVVCAVGIADCGRWLKSLRRYWEWVEFENRLQADRLNRLRTGVSELVEPEEIMVRDPASAKHEAELRTKYPARAFKLELASADAIMNFVPVEHVTSGRVPPVLFIGVEGDTLTPYEETLDFYERCSGPKELLTLRGMTHHELYQPQNLFGVLESVSGFLAGHLAPGAAGRQ